MGIVLGDIGILVGTVLEDINSLVGIVLMGFVLVGIVLEASGLVAFSILGDIIEVGSIHLALVLASVDNPMDIVVVGDMFMEQHMASHLMGIKELIVDNLGSCHLHLEEQQLLLVVGIMAVVELRIEGLPFVRASFVRASCPCHLLLILFVGILSQD